MSWLDDIRRSVVCLSSDCEQGRARLAGMRSAFDAMGQPSQFSAAVAALEAEAARVEAEIGWSTAFDSGCCALAEVGSRAQRLVEQMSSAGGVYAPTTPANAGDTIGGALGLAAVAVIVIAGVLLYRETKS